ncbi:hypothetical protein Nepgr_023744 [Nepenthes gracilis]|uniref:Uncharacterized protein n=1 Tax=Nepenthes gracilis TaxID=150966 RepID=A0AAD3XZR3_NEPGR|nr:hypothetical protein Nepgr_023744 [Nepenthes gracilis]
MHNQRHYMDFQENSSSYGDPKSWFSDNFHSSPQPDSSLPRSAAASAATGCGTNVDRVLYNDLVEIVPLVQSLIDRKPNSSFTRRGSINYTKTPSRYTLSKHVDPKGRNAAKSVPGKKRGEDLLDEHQGKNPNSHTDESGVDFSTFTSTNMVAEKDREELLALREQVEHLQQKLSEREELLKEVDNSKNRMSSMQEKVDEMKRYVAEKDILVKSTQQQLSDTKIKLADRQASLEKVQWEALTSKQMVEKLQEEICSIETQISSFMLLLEDLPKDDSILCAEDYDILPYHMDHPSCLDDMDEMGIQKMDEARKAYIAAVAMAKEKQDEESLAAAVNARLHLQSFAFGTNNSIIQENCEDGNFMTSTEAFAH